MTQEQQVAISKYQAGLMMWLDLYTQDIIKKESIQDNPTMNDVYIGAMNAIGDFKKQVEKYKVGDPIYPVATPLTKISKKKK